MVYWAEKIDHQALIRELLIALRGDRSQEQLNRILGLKDEQIYRWESQRAAISWPDFCRLCAKVKAPLAPSLHNGLAYAGNPLDFSGLLSHLSGKQKQSEVAARANVSRSLISRWKRAEASPTLLQVLRLVGTSPYSTHGWIALLVPPHKLPSLSAEIARHKEETDLHCKYPWIAALVLVLRTKEYAALERHEAGYIAKRIGISVEQEKSALASLCALGIVSYKKKRYYYLRHKLSTAGNFEGTRKIREYWAKRSLHYIESLAHPNPKNSWGYLVFTTTPENAERIRKKYLEFYQEIDNLVYANSEAGGSTEVHLMSIQILRVEDLPPA